MSKLDDIERLARTSERLTILTPFTTLQMVEVIRAATVLRKRLEYPHTGGDLTERRRELLAFDAAMAELDKL
jgi:hypothetical protein